MRIKISYPSGNVLHLSGEWKGPGNVDGNCIILILVDEDYIVPDSGGVVIPKDVAFVGDIRGVYQDEDSGRILYNPKESVEGMNKWAVDWLDEHPEWPAILELAKGGD